MKIKKATIMAYALKNALEHEGNAIAGAVVNSLFNEGLKKSEIKEIMPEVLDILNKINRWGRDIQEREFEKLEDFVSKRKVREGMQELEGVGRKGIVTRFAPSASGPFHVGHALTASLSFLYVQKYGGKFYVRIEDTNPENSFKDSYKLIEKDSDWLFKGEAKIVIQSERIKLYYKYAEKLIKKRKAYVCECSVDRFKDFVNARKNCPCRELNIKKQMEKWKNMLDKKGYKEGDAVLRFKSDMKHKNPAMRDFPLARISESVHPMQGRKCRVWPLMNLAVAVDDIEMKMTHLIRGKDHRDNALRQQMIYKVLGKKSPKNYFLGRINFKDMELSTSQMRRDIKAGKYKGWDDERLPTLAALRKKGYKPSAFWRFTEQIGFSEVDKTMDKREFFLLLDNFNMEKTTASSRQGAI